MSRPVTAFPDPRVEPGQAPGLQADLLYRVAEASLAGESEAGAERHNRVLRDALAAMLVARDPPLEAVLAHAPSPVVARHLYRQLDAAWRALPGEGPEILQLFAIPVVIVAAVEGASVECTLTGVIDPAPLIAVLREGEALAGNQQFALAGMLLAPQALDVSQLPAWTAYRRERLGAGDAGSGGEHALPAMASAMTVPVGREGVHLRFLVGTAIAAASADLFREPRLQAWGMSFTRELSRQLARPGAAVLALPRAPQTPLLALQQGLAAQREVSAQLFVSNAVRRMRASTGEPVAVISAHRAAEAPGGGELRLSLSSAFDARAAEGFRCPLHPTERVSEVLAMLTSVLEECRVAVVRLLGGIHPDRTPDGMQPLLFKPEALPGEAALLQ